MAIWWIFLYIHDNMHFRLESPLKAHYKALDGGEYALSVFFDIVQGAFDNTLITFT